MIISRTPYRISFFGGGTDYPVWYRENGGAVLSTTIDKYCYLSCRYLPPFFKHKHRVVWSKIENVRSIEKIKHPAVRAALQWLKISEGMEIHHAGDLPARSGLGSSSSFAVGLINSLYCLQGQSVSKMQLAQDAIYLERELLREHVGSQDQVSAAFGGFNKITFQPNDKIMLEPIQVDSKRLDELHKHLVLIFTGKPRSASDIAALQIKNTPKKSTELNAMFKMVDEGVKILRSNQDISDFGRLLLESWKLKRSLSAKISNGKIDDIYAIGLKAGALGGKLLGAGGTGFMLFFVPPEKQTNFRKKLPKLLSVPFEFENYGSQVIFNSN